LYDHVGVRIPSNQPTFADWGENACVISSMQQHQQQQQQQQPLERRHVISIDSLAVDAELNENQREEARKRV
jgi:flagellar hook-length control protein FliK